LIRFPNFLLRTFIALTKKRFCSRAIPVALIPFLLNWFSKSAEAKAVIHLKRLTKC
jgi:hypothetical protein